MMSHLTDRVGAFLEDIRLIDPVRHQLIEAIMQQIAQLDPAITSEVKYGGLLFSKGHAFCGIFSYSQHVSLEFGEGAQLTDTHLALEGGGKQRRHIKLRSQDDIAKKQISFYLKLAYQLALQP